MYTDGAAVSAEARQRARLGSHRRYAQRLHRDAVLSERHLRPAIRRYCASQPNGTPYATRPVRAAARPTSPPSPAMPRSSSTTRPERSPGQRLRHRRPRSGRGSDVYNEHFSEGGTSLSSPLWAGMWARVNAAHISGPLGRANRHDLPVASEPSRLHRVPRHHRWRQSASGHARVGFPDWSWVPRTHRSHQGRGRRDAEAGAERDARRANRIRPRSWRTVLRLRLPGDRSPTSSGDASSLPHPRRSSTSSTATSALASDGRPLRVESHRERLQRQVSPGLDVDGLHRLLDEARRPACHRPRRTRKDYYAVETSPSTPAAPSTYTDGNARVQRLRATPSTPR